MNNTKQNRDGMEGRLPAMAPLANPYVPFQMEDPPKYEARKAFIRGTLYPGLDLPFMGMVNNEEKPVTPQSELQVLGFALHELALYLDTHRDDREALELYRQYQRIYHDGMMVRYFRTPLKIPIGQATYTKEFAMPRGNSTIRSVPLN